MRRHECFGLLLMIIYLGSFFGYDVVFTIFSIEKRSPSFFLINWLMGNFIVLTLMYTIVCVILNCEMNSMVGDFRKEIRSINCQFIVFLFAYLTKCTYVWTLTHDG